MHNVFFISEAGVFRHHKKNPYMIGTATRDKTATPIKLCMGHTCASKYTGIVYYKDGSHVYS